MERPLERIVLGSRSPRRLELLSLIVPRERIEVRPPRLSDEAGFAGFNTQPEIEARLAEIARAKNADVREPLDPAGPPVLTADTVIVGQADDGTLAVLGQPPQDESWRQAVRHWFRRYYFGRTHAALTAVCLTTPAGRCAELVVRSSVTFCAADEDLLEWYLSTQEPRGKAGGYALQGAGGVFVERVNGSLSNVVGLPLREVREMLEAAGIEIALSLP
jgi:septum formation protein